MFSIEKTTMTAVAAPGLSGGGGGGGGGLGNNNGMNTVGSNVMIDLTSHSVAASTSSAALTLRQRDARRELELAKQK